MCHQVELVLTGTHFTFRGSRFWSIFSPILHAYNNPLEKTRVQPNQVDLIGHVLKHLVHLHKALEQEECVSGSNSCLEMLWLCHKIA